MDKNKDTDNYASTLYYTPTISIPLSEYEYLRSRDIILAKLEAGGVDNWEWYSECFRDDEE